MQYTADKCSHCNNIKQGYELTKFTYFLRDSTEHYYALICHECLEDLDDRSKNNSI